MEQAAARMVFMVEAYVLFGQCHNPRLVVAWVAYFSSEENAIKDMEIQAATGRYERIIVRPA